MGNILSRNGKLNADGTFNWKDACTDAGIIAGMTFFASLGSLGLTNALTVLGVMAALISSGAAFFTTLAIKRGLREKPS